MLAALLVLNSGGTPHSNRTACNVHSLQILRYLLVGRFSSKLKNFIPEGLNEIKIPLVQNSCRKLRRTGAVATRSWQGGFCLIRQKIPKQGRRFFWFVFFRRVKKMNKTWTRVKTTQIDVRRSTQFPNPPLIDFNPKPLTKTQRNLHTIAWCCTVLH